MSREIKFRAWVKKEKEMTKVLALETKDYATLNVLYNDNSKCTLGMFAVEIMQYTGLKDKNGKEIYEGDIVILNDAEEENRCVVKYKYGSYILVDGDLREDLSNVEDKFLEVVGNIYENKNLLEENKWVNTK